MAKFYKGQKIVALQDFSLHPEWGFTLEIKKGDVLICDGYCKHICDIDSMYLVGEKGTYRANTICECGMKYTGLRVLFRDKNFAPLQETREHNKAEINCSFPKELAAPKETVERVLEPVND